MYQFANWFLGYSAYESDVETVITQSYVAPWAVERYIFTKDIHRARDGYRRKHVLSAVDHLDNQYDIKTQCLILKWSNLHHTGDADLTSDVFLNQLATKRAFKKCIEQGTVPPVPTLQ